MVQRSAFSLTSCIVPYIKYCFHIPQLIAENWISFPRLRTRLLKVTWSEQSQSRARVSAWQSVFQKNDVYHTTLVLLKKESTDANWVTQITFCILNTWKKNRDTCSALQWYRFNWFWSFGYFFIYLSIYLSIYLLSIYLYLFNSFFTFFLSFFGTIQAKTDGKCILLGFVPPTQWFE